MINTFIVIPILQFNRYKLDYFSIENINGVRKLRKQLNQICSTNITEDNFKVKLQVDNLNMFLQSNSGNIYPFFVKKNNEEEYIFSLWVFNGITLGSFYLKEIDNNTVVKINDLILDYEQNEIVQCTQCSTKISKYIKNKYYTGVYCDTCWESIKPKVKEDNHD